MVFVFKETEDLIENSNNKYATRVRNAVLALGYSINHLEDKEDDDYISKIFLNTLTELEKNYRLIRLNGLIDDERLINVLMQVEKFRSMV